MMEITSMVVIFMIFAVGFLAIFAGLLYLSLVLLGRILKMLGYWKVTLQAVGRIYQEKRKR
jgi:hypothetical protein